MLCPEQSSSYPGAVLHPEAVLHRHAVQSCHSGHLRVTLLCDIYYLFGGLLHIACFVFKPYVFINHPVALHLTVPPSGITWGRTPGNVLRPGRPRMIATQQERFASPYYNLAPCAPVV
jgi:hypothetical protein